jgi:hypothetical protein
MKALKGRTNACRNRGLGLERPSESTLGLRPEPAIGPAKGRTRWVSPRNDEAKRINRKSHQSRKARQSKSASMGGFQAFVAWHMRDDPGQYLAVEVGIGRMPGRPRRRNGHRRKTFAGTLASRVARTLARIFQGRTGRRRLARPRKHEVALRLYIPALQRLGGSGRPFVHDGS